MARCALIIGITAYNSFPGLPHVAAGVSSLTSQLKQHGYDVVSLPTEKIEVEQQEANSNRKLNSVELAKGLKDFIQQRAYQNEAFVFFSGYVLQTINPITDEPEAYMVASDTTQEGKDSISFRDINILIQKSELRSLVMLLDCCSNSLDEKYNLLQSTQAAIQFKPNYCLIASCHKPIRFEGRYEIFTAAVLNGLSIDQMINGKVTSIDLFNSISQELKIKGQRIVQTNVEKAILIASQDVQQLNDIKIDESQAPYCGLKPFERQYEKFFFGRKQLIEQIFRKLDQSRFVVVIGASGSGKSSMIQAGLLPLLEKTAWQILPLIKPGNSPLTKLLIIFEPFLQNSHSSLQINELIHNVSNGLYELVSCLPELDHYLLAIDQFEEVFTLSPMNERQRFIELLVQLIEQPHPRLSIILVMRVDFLEQCLNNSEMTELIQNHGVYIPPLQKAEWRQVIIEPAYAQGYNFEAGLLTKILGDVKQELSQLSLLQFALLKLWERRDRQKRQLTYSTYLEMGGVIGALDYYAEQLYKSFSALEQGWVKEIFLQLVRSVAQMKDVRQQRSKQQLMELLSKDSENHNIITVILQKLADEQLIVLKQDEEETWVDLAHESLMDGWQRFAEWRQENWKLRQLIARVEDALRDWQGDENQDHLMMGKLLKLAQSNWEALEPKLSQDAKKFYQVSLEYADRQALQLKLGQKILSSHIPKKESTINFLGSRVESSNPRKISIPGQEEHRQETDLEQRTKNIEPQQEILEQVELLNSSKNTDILSKLSQKGVSLTYINGDYINVEGVSNCEGLAFGRDARGISQKNQNLKQD